MVYYLKLNMVTDDQALIDAVKTKAKNKIDPDLWQGDNGWDKFIGVNPNGHKVIRSTMRFLSQTKRDSAYDWLETKAINSADKLIGPEVDSFGEEIQGSFVEAHTCDHRIGFGGCTVTSRWDK